MSSSTPRGDARANHARLARLRLLSLASASVTLLAACGGGGGGAPTPPPPAPPPPPTLTLQADSSEITAGAAVGTVHAAVTGGTGSIQWSATDAQGNAAPGTLDVSTDARTAVYHPDTEAFTSDQPVTVTIQATLAYGPKPTDVETRSVDLTVDPGASPGRFWTTEFYGAHPWQALAWANGLFVAGSADGTLVTSTDGTLWSYPSTPLAQGVQALAYGPAGWVASTSGGSTLTSADGSTWTAHDAGLPTIVSMTAGNGLYVALSGSSSYASADGVTWASAPFDRQKVAFAGGHFVAMAAGSVATLPSVSTDGLHWSTAGTSAGGRALAAGPAGFLASDGFDTWSSPDGLAWTTASSGSTRVVPDENIAYAGNGFYSYGTADGVRTLDGGQTWTPAAVVDAVEAPVTGLASDGHAWVRVSATGAIETSTDGTAFSTAVQGSVGDLKSVTTSDGVMMAVSDRGYAISTSSNIPFASAPVTHEAIHGHVSAFAVAAGGGRFVASAAATRTAGTSDAVVGVFATSTDRINWTAVDAPGGRVCHALVNDGQRFVAGCDDGAILASTDGTTWSLLATLPGAPQVTSLAWNGSRYLVGTWTGMGATSPDGVTWSDLATVFPGGPVTSSTWSGQAWLAVGGDPIAGDTGWVATSPDGTTWTLVAQTLMKDPSGVACRTGGDCVIAGSNALASTRDLVKWTARSVFPLAALNAIVYDGTAFVAVGNAGATVRSSQ